MGKVLGDALATVRDRSSGRGGEMGDARNNNNGEDSRDLLSGKTAFVDGLRGVCRALFHHCVGAIGFAAPGVLIGVSGVFGDGDWWRCGDTDWPRRRGADWESMG